MSSLEVPRKSWYLSLVDRTARPRFDVFPIFADPAALHHLLSDITNTFHDAVYDKVVAVDAIGFVLGGALAAFSKKPFYPIRKSGKLPFEDLESRSIQDWDGEKGLEIKKDWINKGDRIVLVDEWIGEGFQIKAAIDMIETLGATLSWCGNTGCLLQTALFANISNADANNDGHVVDMMLAILDQFCEHTKPGKFQVASNIL